MPANTHDLAVGTKTATRQRWPVETTAEVFRLDRMSFQVRFPGKTQYGVSRGAVQPGGGCPACAHRRDRLPDGDVDRSMPWEVVPGPQDRARASDGDRYDRDPCLGGDDERTHVERSHSGRAGQAALGEYHQ